MVWHNQPQNKPEKYNIVILLIMIHFLCWFCQSILHKFCCWCCWCDFLNRYQIALAAALNNKSITNSFVIFEWYTGSETFECKISFIKVACVTQIFLNTLCSSISNFQVQLHAQFFAKQRWRILIVFATNQMVNDQNEKNYMLKNYIITCNVAFYEVLSSWYLKG